MIPNIKLFPKQMEALDRLMDRIKEYIVYGGGAGGGKSWLGNTWLAIMTHAYPETKYFIAREERKRILESTFITWGKVCRKYGIPRDSWKYNDKYSYIGLKNGSRIDLVELKNKPGDPEYERLGSSEYTSGWIEEGGEVHYKAYDVISSRTGRHLNDHYGITGKTFITCNPKKNWLYTDFYSPWRSGILPKDKAFIQSLVRDNIFGEKGYLRKLQNINDETTKQRLLFGNWDYSDDPDQLIVFEWCEQSRDQLIILGKKTAGVDVARYGDDLTSIATMAGNDLQKLMTRKHLSVDLVVDIVKAEIKKSRIDADRVGVDVVGIGAGVVDYLRRANIRVKSISSGDKAEPIPGQQDYTFANLRSQMWWVMRESLKPGSEFPIRIGDIENRQQLVEDLTAVRYTISGDRQIKVESKKDIKKRLGRSTDYADAVVYANWVRYQEAHRAKAGYHGFGKRIEW